MCKKMLFCGVLVGLMMFLAVSANAGIVQFDHNVDGQLPNAEQTSMARVQNAEPWSFSESVSGGLWTVTDEDTADGDYLYYNGNNIPLSTNDTSLCMSISTRMQLTLSCDPTYGNFYMILGGPAGWIYLRFDYDADTGYSAIGGRRGDGSVLWRELPTGETLGDMHEIIAFFDPAASTTEFKLYVDGEFIGTTGLDIDHTSDRGIVQFGDGDTRGDDTSWEIDWMSYANGNDAIPEPATMSLLGLGSLLLIRRRNNK